MKKIWNKIKGLFSKAECKEENAYSLEGIVPLKKALPFAIQHVLAMFMANITPVLLITGVLKDLEPSRVAMLVQNAIFIAGIGTIIQLYAVWKIGARLPVVMGTSFTFVSILSYIGIQYGFGTMIGSVIVGGIVIGILGLFAKYWRKFISPIVAACVVTGIGLSLLTVGAGSFGGGISSIDFGSWKYLTVGLVTMVTCIIFNSVKNKTLNQISILIGVVTGYILSICLGMVDFSSINTGEIISFPKLMTFSEIEFNISAIISVMVIYIVSSSEIIGEVCALTYSSLDREATEKELSGAISATGFVSAISGIFGCPPLTIYGQNVGIVSLSKVINRFPIFLGAIMLVFIGLFPILGSIISTLPDAVLGGCTLMLFASIVVTGISMISKCGFTKRNSLIVSISVGVGYGFSITNGIYQNFPEILQIIGNNSVAVMFVIALILDILLPKEKKIINTDNNNINNINEETIVKIDENDINS